MNPALALDRSLRSVDADGHLRVEMSRISKANICSYLGREIPDPDGTLRLDPNRVYKLFRDPKELEKGASSFDGKPLLIKHVPVTADLPHQSLWVGTIGACTFEAPYLTTRPLTVITREAQDLIEADEQRELSAGYRYRYEPTPGVYGGEAYDGRMVDIQGNHVALVSAGRAGPDVLVADEFPLELRSMALKNRKLIARLQKKFPALAALNGADLLAFDAELGETPTKSVVTLDEAEEKAATDEALAEKKKTAGEDAELTEEEKEAAKDRARDKKAKDAAKDKKAKDESKEEEAEDEESEEEAEDEEEEEPKAKKAKDSDPDHRKDFNSMKQGKDKKAKDKAHDSAMTMDQVSAIVEKAVKRAEAATEARVTESVLTQQRALAAAQDEVAPLVGKVHGCDSAQEVYEYTFEKRGIEYEGVHPSAYRALIRSELRVLESGRKTPKHAQDAGAKDYDYDAIMQRVEH